jgi:hypothetical protein
MLTGFVTYDQYKGKNQAFNFETDSYVARNGRRHQLEALLILAVTGGMRRDKLLVLR